MESGGVSSVDDDDAKNLENGDRPRFSGDSEEKTKKGLLAELADAVDSKSTARKGVSVRLR